MTHGDIRSVMRGIDEQVEEFRRAKINLFFRTLSPNEQLSVIYMECESIVNNNELEWEDKYDLIFSDNISKKVFEICSMDYYDPDTSYEEDVMAFVNALKRKIEDNSDV